MKHINNFKIFKEAFKPKRLEGREEEAEKKGIRVNWLKKARLGLLKGLSWQDSDEPNDVYFGDRTDKRMCLLFTPYKDEKNDYLFASLYKQKIDQVNRMPWVLTIEDHYGSVSKERFQNFEEARVKMLEYFGVLPKVYNY